MAYTDHNAKNYGDALFLLAEELKQTDEIKDDLDLLSKIIKENPDYIKLLDTPALSREERVKIAGEAFKALNKNLVNLVKILVEKRITYLIFKIKEAYMSAYDQSRGIERVEAITVIPLTNAQLERLEKKLAVLTRKQIIVKNTIDSSILGGMKLRYMGIQIDDSVKTKLDSFEKSLKDIVI